MASGGRVPNNSTSMSLHERFSKLRTVSGLSQKLARDGPARRETTANLQKASSKNNRLAKQMERRSATLAALKIKKKSIKQRLGTTQTTFSTGARFRGALTQKQRRLTTSSVRGKPSNQTRLSPVKKARAAATAGRSTAQNAPRGTVRTGQVRGARKQVTAGVSTPNRAKLRGKGGRGRGAVQQQQRLSPAQVSGRGRGRGQQRAARGASQAARGGSGRGVFRGTARGRGQDGGRGRGRRGGGRGGSNAKVSKEDLDKQLDQYMAKTKNALDRDLDSYMNRDVDMS